MLLVVGGWKIYCDSNMPEYVDDLEMIPRRDFGSVSIQRPGLEIEISMGFQELKKLGANLLFGWGK
jgi:hypothetical protein